MSSKATLALLIYGLIMHYSVNCSPVGLSFPSVRYVHSHRSSVTFQMLISLIALSGRAQAKDHICFTVSYVRGYNSLLDYWITSSDSQSIGLLTQT